MKQHEQNSLWGLIAWLTASLFYSYHSMIVSAITVIPETFAVKYGMTNAQYGDMTVAYTIAYSIMQIPVGIMLDHFSIKKLLSSALLLFTLGCVTMAVSQSYLLILVTRFLMGASAAFTVLSSFKLAAEWFDSNHFATLSGLTVSLGYFGSMLGNAPFLSLLEYYSYEQVFWGFALIGLGLSAMSFVFVGNYQPVAGGELKFSGIFNDIKTVATTRLSVILIIYAMLIFTPLQVLKDSLGVMFFTNYYGYSKAVATYIMSIILLAGVVAAPSLGVISDRMQKRRPIIVLSPVCIFVTLMLLLFKLDVGSANSSFALVFALAGLFGFMTWGFLLSYTVFKETHSPQIVSLGLGVMNSVNMFGGIVCVPIITRILDMGPDVSSGISTQHLYFYAFLILPVVIALAFPLLKHIPETHCRQVE